jgi:hypothetical protein
MVGKFVVVACGALASLMLSAPAQAQRRAAQTGTPQQFQQLMACRAIADAQQRLACFDSQAASMAAAVERRDLVMIDRERARAARKSLFGFSTPDFAGLFGGGDDEVKQVEGLVASADYTRYMGWTIKLQDGSVWTQIDSTVLPLDPKRGEKVVIRRSALGSYFIKVGKQIGFRGKRIG